MGHLGEQQQQPIKTSETLDKVDDIAQEAIRAGAATVDDHGSQLNQQVRNTVHDPDVHNTAEVRNVEDPNRNLADNVAAANVKDAANNVAANVKDSANNVAANVKDSANNVAANVKDTANNAAANVKDAAA